MTAWYRGWTTARFARRCRIPAVFGVAVSGLLTSVWTIWKNPQIVWPESPGHHFNVWTSLWPIPLMTVLVLSGGGLLIGLAEAFDTNAVMNA